MGMNASRIICFPLALGCLVVIAAWSPPAQAATLHVANHGVDGPECGKTAAPCRSISKAIALAGEGDKIIVGPGHYGDLDGDGTFEPAAGEEAAETSTGCRCMINVNKRLTIQSSVGSAATVLDAGGRQISVVSITADDVTFGGPTKGFTLTGAGAGRAGLFIAATTAGVKVQGCQAVGNTGRGFDVQGERHTLARNLAMRNAEWGFIVNCTDCTVSRNVATVNDSKGFMVDGSANRVLDNVAVRNGESGFDVSGSGHIVRHNSAIGNRQAGFLVQSVDALITANNMFGNFDQTLFGFTLNCGLFNFSGVHLHAEGNYWGAATGPGGNPADVACGSTPSATTEVAPFARQPFSVSPPVRR
jgi:hypothetical protein